MNEAIVIMMVGIAAMLSIAIIAIFAIRDTKEQDLRNDLITLLEKRIAKNEEEIKNLLDK